MPFRTQRRVEFRDTDAAGIVHFSAFFPMMESAEHEMLRSIGLSVMPSTARRDTATPGGVAETRVTWPRVTAQCDYLAAARFEDLLDIEITVEKIGNSSVRYRFTFTRESEPIAEGLMTVVCCELTDAGLSKTEIPCEIRQSLEQIGG